jgi:hypothetical protein
MAMIEVMQDTQERVLYDLAGAEPERRFSPYCWRTRMALAHKGLSVRTVPWRFTDKDVIAFSGQGRVPVLVDGETTVHDSWTIAVYLEEHYPDRPSLFHGPAATAVTRFVNSWGDRVLLPMVATLVVRDILDHLHEKDREYFRTSREKAFGKPLEAVGPTATRAWRRSVRRWSRCAPCCVRNHSSRATPRPMPTTSRSACCNGRAQSARSRCWRPAIPCSPGASGCWTRSTD